VAQAGQAIRILSVDDHQLMREGIAAVLRREPDMDLVAEAADGVEAVELYEALRPDITLLDLQMPRMNGVDALKAIRTRHAEARIVVLTTYEGDAQAVAALKAGARGYLLKTSLLSELIHTIRKVHEGRRHIPAEMAIQLACFSPGESLTPREIEILRLVAVGSPNKQVALDLSISAETVKMHMKNIMEKLGANDRTHAVTIALNRGFLSLK
jgi:DNA-binding NarL/FixJ family response regulator